MQPQISGSRPAFSFQWFAQRRPTPIGHGESASNFKLAATFSVRGLFDRRFPDLSCRARAARVLLPERPLVFGSQTIRRK
jgi:hypothetical protein